MLKPDVPVWYDFLEKWGGDIQNLWYDSYLGGPILTAEEERQEWKRLWRDSISKRADAIAELEDEVWLIEVAYQPGLRAIGQLQTYRALWLRDPVIPKIERPLLVCRQIEPDLLDAASMHGILVYIV